MFINGGEDPVVRPGPLDPPFPTRNQLDLVASKPGPGAGCKPGGPIHTNTSGSALSGIGHKAARALAHRSTSCST